MAGSHEVKVAPQLPPAPRDRVEEMAQRLERIANLLRERGPRGPLEDEQVDQLGALVVGYLLGASEAERR